MAEVREEPEADSDIWWGDEDREDDEIVVSTAPGWEDVEFVRSRARPPDEPDPERG